VETIREHVAWLALFALFESFVFNTRSEVRRFLGVVGIQRLLKPVSCDFVRNALRIEIGIVLQSGVNPNITVDVKAGRAVRHYKVVKSGRPEISSSSPSGQARRCDNNILSRHIKQPRANSACPGSTGVACEPRMQPGWSRQGANPKDVQARCGTLASRPPWTSMRSSCRSHSGARWPRCLRWWSPARRSRSRRIRAVLRCRRNREWRIT
jgi:hypothetical protein